MVVTRRTPAAPPSRQPSTQAVPRTASARAQNASKLKESEATNGDVDDTAPKKFRREKPKAKKGKGKKKSKSLLDVLTKWLLLFFTIYSLSVCPKDEKLERPLCRGLDAYRRLVLEAYVIPAFHRVIENPSVAPYVEQAKPYADKALVLAQRADNAFHTQVVPAFNAHVVPVWNDRVVPAWDAHVVPQWNAHVIPQYEQHVAPHFTKAQSAVAPYYSIASEKYDQAQKIYISHVDPYARQAGAALHKAQVAATPYAHLAAQKSYEGYLAARPYAGPAWIKFKQLCLDILALLRVQRRRYVDPHVVQIWNKVVELSQGAPVPAGSTTDSVAKPAPPAEASPAIMKEAEEIVAEPVPEVKPVVDATPSSSSIITSSSPAPAIIEVEEIGQPILSSAVQAATEAASTLSSVVAETAAAATESATSLASAVKSTPTPTPEVVEVVAPVVEVVEDIVEPVVEAAKPVVEKVEEVAEPVIQKVASATKSASSAAAPLATIASESATSAASIATASAAALTESVLAAAAAASESASSIAAQATRITKPAEDLDLDAFYAELGIEEDEAAASAVEEAQAPPEETLTPEQIAEHEAQRKAHIAAKRAAIQARHTVWEEKLDALLVVKQEAVRKGLVAARKTAVVEFKSDDGIKGAVDGLVAEAEKFLAGAEAFLKNLKKEEGKKGEEKDVAWSKVLNKIDDKFNQRLAETEGAVNGWWDAYNAREEREVREHADEIKDMAESAQADVGLDYVWLEDVTYNDWQRYHDLIRRYERFLEDSLSVQNGSHDNPPVNPVETALIDLEAEVKDIVTGFETRLRQLRRSGARAFKEDKDEEEVKEAASEELNLSNDEEKLLQEPEMVSILPIPTDEPHPEAIVAPDVPVVGRGKEEVEQAFARAAEAEEAVVAEAATEEAAAPVHEEL
ncbi:unnamed protein product [Peniophora sp. CBMAI 1063]|nr:unnamed protein product [Peniophora sp. CBMAI 1063]